MLDARLQAILNLISPCERLADVGTDHGYIPLEAIKTGLCTFAYAADIKAGPLKHARATFANSGYEDKVEFIVCDGLSAIPDPLDAVVIAGMGAQTALPIIQNDLDRFRSIPQIIVQCNKDVGLLRRTMVGLGFAIVDETIAFQRHTYIAVKFKPSVQGSIYSDMELNYGPVLLQKRERLLLDYLHTRHDHLRQLAKHITDDSRRSAFLDEAFAIRAYLDKES
jgi:tRNA (adenine22-N1)-methyltransferase